jgi:hypothetical protein
MAVTQNSSVPKRRRNMHTVSPKVVSYRERRKRRRIRTAYQSRQQQQTSPCPNTFSEVDRTTLTPTPNHATALLMRVHHSVSTNRHYTPRLPSLASKPVFLTNLPLALTRFCNLASRSLARSDGVLPLPAKMDGSDGSVSVDGVCCRGTAGLPARCSVLKSRYVLADGLSGMGAGNAGRSAPFCNRSSATEKGLRVGCGVVGRAPGPGETAGDVEAEGEAGSAAARARNTTCVPRERSRELGLARRASAYNTLPMSFFFTDASNVSSGVA